MFLIRNMEGKERNVGRLVDIYIVLSEGNDTTSKICSSLSAKLFLAGLI